MQKILYISMLCFFMGTVSAQNWEQVASLPSNFQTDHTFGFALDGKGYVVAGATQNGLSNALYSYDADADVWTRMNNFPGGFRGFGIGDTYDGKAYFGFGQGVLGVEGDLWSFDPATMNWTELAPCPCEARIHPAMVAHDGKIYMGLGGASTGNLGDWWAYDIVDNSWEELADFPGADRHHPFQFALEDFVYVGFGHGNGFISDRWYRYDPAIDVWTEVASLPGEGRVAGAQFSHNGLGYVLSGDGEDHSSMAEGEFWSYDPSNDDWLQLPSHPGKSRWAPASFVLNDEVYLINGPNTDVFPSVYRSEIYKFDLGPSVSTNNQEVIEYDFAVTPNPVYNTINLQIKSEANQIIWDEIRIRDASGRLLKAEKYSDNSIDVDYLSSGMYFLELLNDGQKATTKFLKI